MPTTKETDWDALIPKTVAEALATGLWMLRRDYDGVSHAGFTWRPVGELTVAPDWDPDRACGGGLHGVGPTSTGYYTDGRRLVFCAVPAVRVSIDSHNVKCADDGAVQKIKVPAARVLLVNELPEGLSVGGSLDLRGTQITQLPEGLSVGGSLYLRGTQITQLPEGLSVGGYLYLRGTQITQLPEGLAKQVIR